MRQAIGSEFLRDGHYHLLTPDIDLELRERIKSRGFHEAAGPGVEHGMVPRTTNPSLTEHSISQRCSVMGAGPSKRMNLPVELHEKDFLILGNGEPFHLPFFEIT
jgi:hypothetical protein